MKVYRWGIHGPGGIAARFAEGMQWVPDGTIAAVSSRNADRANAFAERFDIPRRYVGREALAADAEVDIVYVATPHTSHAADTISFLEAGKHVLCEKPFAVNAREARTMVEAARANGRFLMEAMWSRFLPAYRELVSMLGQGTIGEPLRVEADFGFRMPVNPEHRLFSRALGGGALLDLGIYPVQLCSLVLGTPDGISAQASIGATGVDEQVAAALHAPGGRLGVVTAAIRVVTGCTARISGSEGWIELPRFMHRPDFIVLGTASGEKDIDTSFDGDGLRFQAEEVQRCIATGQLESAVMPLAESVSIAETLDAIRAEIGVTYAAD